MHALLDNRRRTRGLVSSAFAAPRSITMGVGPMAAGAQPGSPSGVVAQITEAWRQHQAETETRYDEIVGVVNQLNTRLESMRIGGAGDDGAGRAPAAQRAAVRNLNRFARTGKPEDLVAGFQVNAAMSTDSGPDGGFVTPDELATEIARVQRDESPMRRLARVVTSSASVFKQPISLGGTAAGWVGERQARTETDADSLAMLEYPAMEVYANPAITQALLDDAAFDMGAHLTQEIGSAFADMEAAAFVTGSGVNQPRGFLSYNTSSAADASRDFGVLQYTPTGEAADLIAEDPGDPLINLVYSLKAKYRTNATWIMNSTLAAKVRKFKDDQDNYLWAPGLQAGQPDRLLGYPVEIDEGMPNVAANAYPIAFGDFKRGYMIVDRIGVRILRDPYTNRPYVHFYSTKRVGGGLLDSNAIKLLKCATS